jgi:hypothetical protein
MKLRRFLDKSVSSAPEFHVPVSLIMEHIPYLLKQLTLKHLTLDHMKLEFSRWMTFTVN